MVQLPTNPALLPLKLGQFDPIQHLVFRRFGFASIIPPASSIAAEDQQWQQWLKAEEFRAELGKYPYEKIQYLLAEAIEEDWNQKPAADFAHYAKLSYWTLEEGLALSFGKEPGALKWTGVEKFVGRSPLATEFAKRREIVQRAKQMGQLWDQTIPFAFVAWAGRMSFPLPEQLVAEIKGLGVQIRDWKSAYDEQAKELSEAQTELGQSRRAYIDARREHAQDLEKMGQKWSDLVKQKDELVRLKDVTIQQLRTQISQLETSAPTPGKSELGTRERQTVSKIIGGMAKKKYRFDPKAAKSPATGSITNDLREIGFSIDEDTVRKFLDASRELLIEAEQG